MSRLEAHLRGNETDSEVRPTTANDDIEVSIVVPCYFDEANLPQLYRRIGPVMDELPGRSELIIVDDGSLDGTVEVAIAEAQRFSHPVAVVRLAKNFGQHPAVIAGLENARGKAVVTLDSDLQYPPEEIPVLLAALDERHSVVSGVRVDRRDPLGRRLVTRLLTLWVRHRTGTELQDVGSMFRAYDRRAVRLILAFPERRPFLPALIAYIGLQVREVPITHQARAGSGSRYRLSTLVDLLFDLITAYSLAALRGASVLGFVGASVGFVSTLALLFYRMIEGKGPSGLVSAFAVVFFLFAIVLALLTLLSETVGRIYLESRGRPRWFAADVRRFHCD